jgi:hypothetical protein
VGTRRLHWRGENFGNRFWFGSPLLFVERFLPGKRTLLSDSVGGVQGVFAWRPCHGWR